VSVLALLIIMCTWEESEVFSNVFYRGEHHFAFGKSETTGDAAEGEHARVKEEMLYFQALMTPVPSDLCPHPPILCTLGQAVANSFRLDPNEVLRVMVDHLNAMEEKKGVVVAGVTRPSKDVWASGEKKFENPFLAFQSWYTNCFSSAAEGKVSSFQLYYPLLWGQPRTGPGRKSVEEQREMKALLEEAYCVAALSALAGVAQSEFISCLFGVYQTTGGVVLSPLLSTAKRDSATGSGGFQHAWRYACGDGKKFQQGTPKRPSFDEDGSLGGFEGSQEAGFVSVGKIRAFTLRRAELQESRPADVRVLSEEKRIFLHPHYRHEAEVCFKGGLPHHSMVGEFEVRIPHLHEEYDPYLHGECFGFESPQQYARYRQYWLQFRRTPTMVWEQSFAHQAEAAKAKLDLLEVVRRQHEEEGDELLRKAFSRWRRGALEAFWFRKAAQLSMANRRLREEQQQKMPATSSSTAVTKATAAGAGEETSEASNVEEPVLHDDDGLTPEKQPVPKSSRRGGHPEKSSGGYPVVIHEKQASGEEASSAVSATGGV